VKFIVFIQGDLKVKLNNSTFFAELIGTLVLVFSGCGAVIFCGSSFTIISIALAFGLSLMTMIYILGPISGCHLNPAVSFAYFLRGKISFVTFTGYTVAQFIGAAIAGALLLTICSFHTNGFDVHAISHYAFAVNGYGIHSPAQFGLVSCFLMETILTSVFIWIILGTGHASFPRGLEGLVIGFSLIMIHLIGTRVTGTSVNPARSFGVALYKGGEALHQLWLFVAAPLAGSVVAVILDLAIGKK
jgi:aquaporin Z